MDSANTIASTSGNANILDDPDELPDFDLIEDIDLKEMAEAQASSSTMSMSDDAAAPAPTMPGVAPSKTSIDVNDPSVVAAMRATTDPSQMGAGSTRDLIRSRNRNLEEKFVVNEIVEDLPSLADYTQGKSGTGGSAQGGMGKKAARREARRAKALDALPEEPEVSALDNLLEKLPFVKKDEEKEEKSLIKVRVCRMGMRWLVSLMAT